MVRSKNLKVTPKLSHVIPSFYCNAPFLHSPESVGGDELKPEAVRECFA